MNKFKPFFKICPANQAKEDFDIIVPSNKSIIIKAIDFTAPPGKQVAVIVRFNPDTANVIVGAAQSDKFISFPLPGQVIEGPAVIRLERDNSQNGSLALLGVGVYYEEL